MTRKSKSANKVRYGKWGYIFSAPFSIIYLVFSAYPLVYTLLMSFSDMKGFAGSKMNFVGWVNYDWVLHSKLFWQSISNTFTIWGTSYIIQFSLGLIIASCLCNRLMNIKGQGFFKYIVYMPSMLTAVAVAMLFSGLFTFPGGFVNTLLKSVGILEEDFKWMGNEDFKRVIFIYLETWRSWGYGMLVTVAAIMGINPELFEAAEIDGANGVQSFFHITLPSIKNVELFLVVAGVTGGLQMYDVPQMMGSTTRTRTLMQFIMGQAFGGDYKYNTAAASSFIVFLVILLINIVVIKLVQGKDERWLRS
jgi:cellobiose transport system permease protein